MSNSRILSRIPSDLANNIGKILSVNESGVIIPEINHAWIKANAAFESANNITPLLEPIFTQANSAFDAANTASEDIITLQGVDLTQNTKLSSAFLQSNSAFDVANSAISEINVIQTINQEQNTKISSAFSHANSGFEFANTVSDFSQSAFTHANSAFDSSNTKFSSSGGTISGNVDIAGSLVVQANLTVSGTVTTISANNLSIVDNMIYLNSDANVANPDIGIAGAYDDGTYHHTGFFRDSTDGVWKVFDNYEPEPDASVWIDTSNSSFRIADFQANNVIANTLSGTANNSNFLEGNTASYFTDYTDTAKEEALSTALAFSIALG